MDKDTFQACIKWGEHLLQSSMCNQQWIVGYMQGIRRHFYGEKFNTEEEHLQWMELADSSDAERRSLGNGYLHGLSGHPLWAVPVDPEIPREKITVGGTEENEE